MCALQKMAHRETARDRESQLNHRQSHLATQSTDLAIRHVAARGGKMVQPAALVLCVKFGLGFDTQERLHISTPEDGLCEEQDSGTG